MEDNSEYSYPTTWDETQTDGMKTWLAEYLRAGFMAGEEPEQDFLDYIMIMIKTQRKIKEIEAELMEIGVTDNDAKEFSNAIADRLKEIAAIQKPAPEAKAESKIVSVVSASTDKKVLGPLKTGRSADHQPQSQSQTHSARGNPQVGGSSRLLQSALQSSRGSVQQGRGGQQFHREDDRNNGQKRGYHDHDHQGDNKRFREQGGGFQDHRAQSQGFQGGRREVVVQPPRPGQPHAAPAPAAATPLNETVQYFEQMNKVAQASGFRNAQEMIASQKEMMAMMQGALPVPAPAPVPGPMFAAPFQMQTPFGAGPPPPPGYPPQHLQQQQHFGFNGFPGRGGRGFSGRGFAGRGAWEGRGGRGRGRFTGRGEGSDGTAAAPAAAAAGAAPGTDGQSSAAEPAGSSAEAPATEAGAPGVEGGPAPTPAVAAEGGFFRGGYQGGYQSRGGRAFGGFGRGGGYQGRNYDPSFAQGGRFGRGGGAFAGRGFNGGGQFAAAAGGPAAAGAADAAPAGNGDGSGAAPTVHKTWVRKPDMNSALVTGR